MTKLFIDGQHGTTGLQLYQRLQHHPAISLLKVDPQRRKDRDYRLECYQQADIVVLCLPDDEAATMAGLSAGLNCRLLDASSAHRRHQDWVYGLPELTAGKRAEIRNGQRVSNPGCYASAAIILLKPLIEERILAADAATIINGYSGYSGGGRALIERYQNGGDYQGIPLALYGLNYQHKHVAEISHWSGLTSNPFFVPAVVNCYQGMLVTIPLPEGAAGEIVNVYRKYYDQQRCIRVSENLPLVEQRYLQLAELGGKDSCTIGCGPTAQQGVLLFALLDNLGKGASGAALQNINIMIGWQEYYGLRGLTNSIDQLEESKW